MLKKAIASITLVIIIGALFEFAIPTSFVQAAPPTNTTAGTATSIASMPYSTSQQVSDAGTTYEVWYSYTAQAGEKLLLLWGYGDNLTPYTPRIRAYSDAGITLLVDSGIGSGAGQDGEQKPIQVPIQSGTTYYFRFTSNAGNPAPAVLNIEAEIAPTTALANGDILVNDDTDGLPAIIVDPATGEVKNSFNNMPAGEGGDVLEDGTILLSDAWNGELELYDKDFNHIADVALDIGFDLSIRANHGQDLFYVGNTNDDPTTVYTVDNAGNIGATTWSLGSTGLRGIAASNDGTVLYYANNNATSPIMRHNLTTDTAMDDLVAGETNYFVSDILVLEDDTLIVLYHTNGGVTMARNIDASGNILNTYNFGTLTMPAFTPPRLAYDLDLNDNFWIWTHLASPDLGMSRFLKIQVSDGSTLDSVDVVEFETGVYQLAASLTPVARAGISFSCPFLILRGHAEAPDFDVEIEKTVDNATPDVDDEIVYTITVTNNGPDTATDIEVSDVLPSEVTYVSSTPSQGTYNDGTGVWTVGDLNNGAVETLTITVTVNSDTAGDTFNNTASKDPDSDTSNDSDTTSVTVNTPPSGGGGGGGGGGSSSSPTPTPSVTPTPTITPTPVVTITPTPPGSTPAPTPPTSITDPPLPRTGLMLAILPGYAGIYILIKLVKSSGLRIYKEQIRVKRVFLNSSLITYVIEEMVPKKYKKKRVVLNGQPVVYLCEC